ncbi:MAG TPA: acylphosphatase [Candidatus Sumerlaeota bacterium]|nr:acylphosphatase [Candidatus Sumerlaeota bacterium]
MPRKHVLVTGLVQGVGFRYFALDEAQQTGVTGWVRNRSDGRVEIEAQGDSSVLNDFLDRIHMGPRHAYVEKVETEEIPEVPLEPEFRMRW